MAEIFQNTLHNDFGTWPLGYIPYGGADFGEVEAVAAAIGDGDDAAYHAAFVAAADRMAAEAETCLARGHDLSARENFLRAAVFYGASFHPLYGAPVDPRLTAAFRKQIAAFDRGLALGPNPVAPQRIPLGDAQMPAYFVPAEGHAAEVRPLIVFTNGYDATVTDLYFLSAVAASRRGYHSLVFDGPGQGEMLYAHGIPLRPDWEVVIRAVVDFAVAHPLVDPERIALSGCSLGGYLAPRGASGEPRLAALIADPGLWSIADGFRGIAVRKFGLPPEAANNLGEVDQAVLDRIGQWIAADPQLHWKVMQRGFWTHGVADLRGYFASAEEFTMDGRAGLIACPTLLTQAEGDALAAAAGTFFDALTCRKTLLRFTAAEGAGGHVEMMNRSLLNRRVLDWLDETL